MLSESFALLGLPQTAPPSEIREVYMRKAQQCHPDLGGNVADFTVLVQAYTEAITWAKDMPCPECTNGWQTLTKGFTQLEIMCNVCLGTGKRGNR